MRIDLSNPFTNDMPVYPGQPLSHLLRTQQANEGQDKAASFNVASRLHVGTHMECAAHVFEKGKLISDIPLEQCFARGVLIDARGKKTIGVDLIPEHVEAKHAVLLCTGMSARYRNDPTYWTTYPALTPEFADELARRRIKMLGMDMAGPEPPPFVSYETHRRLMAHGMLILENLTNLEQLAGVPAFDVIALPVRFAADAAFARVVAIVR